MRAELRGQKFGRVENQKMGNRKGERGLPASGGSEVRGRRSEDGGFEGRKVRRAEDGKMGKSEDRKWALGKRKEERGLPASGGSEVGGSGFVKTSPGQVAVAPLAGSPLRYDKQRSEGKKIRR